MSTEAKIAFGVVAGVALIALGAVAAPYVAGALTSGGAAAAGITSAAKVTPIAFTAVGDPTICPMDKDGNPMKDHCIDYTGPATTLCYDVDGNLQTIDLIGVCEKDGTKCQTSTAHWVGEQWRFDLSTGHWKYRDVRGKSVADVSCLNNWPSEKSEWDNPTAGWVKDFQGRRVFVLHALQPRILDSNNFKGLSFDYIWNALVDPDLKKLKFDKDNAPDWVNAMLMMLGHAQEHNIQRDDLGEMAQHAVMYGIAGRLISV